MLNLDKKVNCGGITRLFGVNQKFMSVDGLSCMMREGDNVKIYDRGNETQVKRLLVFFNKSIILIKNVL